MSSEVIERVEAAVRASGALTGASSERVLALLSGGADSVCLLHVLTALLGPDHVEALHIDHGLRAAAGADERFCRELCRDLGVQFHLERAQVAAERP